MPIHDLGYRAWQGQLCSHASRWLVITQTGARLAWRAPWLRRLVFVAWLPALYMGAAFFMYEQSLTRPDLQMAAQQFFKNFGDEKGSLFDLYGGALQGDPAEARHEVWGWLLLLFFRHPQGVLMALVVGLIAPPLISQDIRSRALLLYFSRPLTRLEYILGKMAIVWGYVAMITTIPALALYITGVMLSPDLSVVSHTWDFPLRILAASVILMVPTTAIALAFSASTSRSYYAGFGWFAVWAFGFVTYYTLYAALENMGKWNDDNHWSLVSLHHTLGRAQTWVFGINDGINSSVFPSFMMLTAISVLSIGFIYQRISAHIKV